MLVDSFALWYEMIKATACAGAFVHALRAQDRFWSEVEAREAHLKRLQFDVVVKTFCDWINALLVKKKETEVAAVSGVANPSPTPALTALNNVNALNWKN